MRAERATSARSMTSASAEAGTASVLAAAASSRSWLRVPGCQPSAPSNLPRVALRGHRRPFFEGDQRGTSHDSVPGEASLSEVQFSAARSDGRTDVGQGWIDVAGRILVEVLVVVQRRGGGVGRGGCRAGRASDHRGARWVCPSRASSNTTGNPSVGGWPRRRARPSAIGTELRLRSLT